MTSPVSRPRCGGKKLDAPDLHPEEFTLTTVDRRFAQVADLWAPMSQGPRLDLREALKRMGRVAG